MTLTSGNIKFVKRPYRNPYAKLIGPISMEIIKVEDSEVDRPPKQKRFWNYIKSLSKDSTGVASTKDNGRRFSSHKDKTDILNRQYQSVFTHEEPDIPVPDPDGDPYPDMEYFTVTEEGVRELLQRSNPGKAIGIDMLPVRLLKECSEELSPILIIIFNKSLQIGTVPDDWKSASVSAVFKKGQRYDPANYRPVSLTCLCCKILEHIIDNNSMKHVDYYKIISDCQHGFRARRSCETQLGTLCHVFTSSLDKGFQSDMAVHDFSKAFDRVPHQRLLRKLLHYGIRGNTHSWIASSLSDSTQRVVVEESLSKRVPVISGVPQGSELGPLLFLLFLNDTPDKIKEKTLCRWLHCV